MALANKRVLLRVDINVPIVDGQVTDLTRIQNIAPTVKEIITAGGQPILLAHLGRPGGTVDRTLSLNQIVPALEQVLVVPGLFVADCRGPAAETAVNLVRKGQVLLLENTRFFKEEEQNNAAFAQKLQNLETYFAMMLSLWRIVRMQAEAITRFMPACVGRHLEAELVSLKKALGCR